MLHVELRRRWSVARAFNLDEQEVLSRFVGPLVAGRTIRYADRDWEPRGTRLTVLEGPELEPGEIGMGRGWANAEKAGTDVTERLLAQGGVAPGGGPATLPPDLVRLKERLLGRVAAGPLPLCDVVTLAAEVLPGRRASEQLALAEEAVWALLHERDVELHRGEGTVGEDDWQVSLVGWPAWGQATTFSISRRRSESSANR